MILPDSNIWIYGIDARTPEHGRVEAWFERADDEIFLIPTIVQLEVLHHIARNVRSERDRTPLASGVFSFPANTKPLTSATVRNARAEIEDHVARGIGGRDAAVLAHALEEDATLVSHDASLLEAAVDAGLDAHDPAASEGLA